MANKEKTIVPTNLLKIREELGYSQKELGDILGVSERMICNYEINESNLPIDKAILLSQKWNFSLDWIYCNNTSDIEQACFKNYSEEENTKFLVDIRNFIRIVGDEVIISMSNNYWKYISKVYEINSSSFTSQEKKRETAQLNGKYKRNDRTNIAWEYSINRDEFISKIHFGDSSLIFARNEASLSTEISEQQIEEVTNFLNSLTRNNGN